MRYAHNGQTRIHALPGGRANCLLCGTELYTACGEIQRWHWRHVNKIDCDPWYAYKSDWHIDWQNEFPENWQEVVINEKGVKHIADIQTPKGMVIEFQHSSISSSQIRERETFYQNMIWIVDAEDFKGNFQIRSKVNSRLRNLEREKHSETSAIEKGLTTEIESKQTQVRELEKTIERNRDQLGRLRARAKKHRETLANIEDFVQKKLIGHWSKSQGFWNYDFDDLLRDIETEFKPKIYSSVTSIQKNSNSINEKKKQLDIIHGLKDILIEDKRFKLVNYDQINDKNCQRVHIINKETKSTLFPEVIKFKNVQDYRNYQYKQDRFEFVIDPEEAVERLQKELMQLEQEQQSQNQEFKSIELAVVKNFSKSLKASIIKLDTQEENLEQDDLGKTEMLQSRKVKLATLESSKESNIKKELKEIEMHYKQQDIEIKISNKGRYTFTWKHERKTWRAATCPLLFDIGESYLFERTTDGQFKKVGIVAFLHEQLYA